MRWLGRAKLPTPTLRKLPNPQVAEFNERPVAKKTKMPFRAAHPRVLLDDLEIGHRPQVRIRDESAVEAHRDPVPDRRDLLLVPLPGGA